MCPSSATRNFIVLSVAGGATGAVADPVNAVFVGIPDVQDRGQVDRASRIFSDVSSNDVLIAAVVPVCLDVSYGS